MGGKSKAPPPPDYSAVANASAASAQLSFQLGQDQLAWAKEQYAKDAELTKGIVDLAQEEALFNDANARADRARYEKIYQPLEDDLAKDARDFASQDRKDLEMGRAQANVAQQFEGQRQAAQQQLESFGVDPTSTRYAALDIGTRAAQAAAQAAAGNQASQMVDAQGRALRSEAINVGRGYPGQIATQYGTATAAGNSAVSNNLATTASGANTMGTGLQWQGTGNQALGVWGNTLNMGYQNQLAAYKANQSNSSGVGSVLGLGASILTKLPGFAQGGAVDDSDMGPMIDGVPYEDMTDRYVTPDRSPSGGEQVDDVSARLNVGEFVIPKDVVEFKGQEFFQRLIQKTRKAVEDAPAKPDVAMMPAQAPAFDTTRRQALPVG